MLRFAEKSVKVLSFNVFDLNNGTITSNTIASLIFTVQLSLGGGGGWWEIMALMENCNFSRLLETI